MRVFKFLFTFLILSLFLCLLLVVDFDHDISREKTSVKFRNENIYKNISEEIIQEKVNFFLNTFDTIQDINITLLEELIMENNYVKKAEVYLGLEDTICIHIDFREPFVKVLKSNRIYYLDSEEVILPTLKNFKHDLIVVSGDIEWDDMDDLFDLVENVYSDNMLSELIGGIYYSKDGGYILSSKLCDVGINIGQKPVFDFDKLKQIELFLIFMSEEIGCDYCDVINIKYDNQIICIN